MQIGVLTFVTDDGIGPVELGVGLEQRGFASLFPRSIRTSRSTPKRRTRAVDPSQGSTTGRWIRLWH